MSEDRRKQHMAPIVWASKWPHGYQITKHCGHMGVVVYQELILATWAANTKKTSGEHICCNVIGYRESRFLAEDSRQHMVWPGVDGDHMCKNGTLHHVPGVLATPCTHECVLCVGHICCLGASHHLVSHPDQCGSVEVWQCGSVPPTLTCHTASATPETIARIPQTQIEMSSKGFKVEFKINIVRLGPSHSANVETQPCGLGYLVSFQIS